MTPAFLRPLDIEGAATNGAPPLDAREDSDYPKPWGDNPDINGHEPVDAITEPIAVAALHDRLRAPDDFELDDVPATALAADPAASAPIGTWKPADLIEFRVVQPWYRTKAVAATLAAVALAAIAVSSVLAVSRGAEQTTSVTPAASSTASPPPSSAQPVPSGGPPAASNTPPAAPTPPPPPPPATTASPPPVWRNHDSWSPSPPSPTKKPEFGVTRAPISATPPPPPKPGPRPDGKPKPWGGLFG